MSIYEELLREGAEGAGGAVRVERPSADRAVVTMNLPDRLNPLSAAVCVGLDGALTGLADERELRTIVLTGEGRAFSAGGDMTMMRRGPGAIADPAGSTDIWRWIRRQFGGVARRIARTDKAFVAAINGPAAGVGLAFALTCDVAIAAESAVLVPAFGAIGLLPEVGSSWALTRKLGYQEAFAMFASGSHLTADEALAAGLVQEVAADDELMDAAGRWCDRFEAMPQHALEMGKTLLRAAADSGWEESVRMEEFAEPNCFTTGAFADAVDGFSTARRSASPSTG